MLNVKVTVTYKLQYNIDTIIIIHKKVNSKFSHRSLNYNINL